MEPIERAQRIQALTTQTMLAIARNALRQMPREQVPGLLQKVATEIAPGADPAAIHSVLDEVLGLGPLEVLLRDKEIREIHIRGPQGIELVRASGRSPSTSVFADERHLQATFQRICKAVNLDPTKGPASAKMADGSDLTVSLTEAGLTATILRA